MYRLSVDEIIKKINNSECFTAFCEDISFSISIESYVPYVCTAIHNGGNIRKSIRDKMGISKFKRWQEEDPYTGQFISSLPIKLIAHDSRYEYDLNRNIDECIYDEVWGKEVWKTELTLKEKEESYIKHGSFYKVYHALIGKLENEFGACLVYDMHSYRHKRENSRANLPVFNIGTEQVTDKRFRKYIDRWIKELSKVELSSTSIDAVENDVFLGKGYLVEYTLKNFKNVLPLATEVKKIYVDENTGDDFPEIIYEIQLGIKEAVLNHATFFIKNMTNMKFKDKYQLLPSSMGDNLKLVDNQLYDLLKNIEIIDFVNPINIETEKKKFFQSKYKKNPSFKYKPLNIDVNEIKREMYKLPVQKIQDINLQLLYKDIIESYSNKLELLSLRDKEEFLYSSLKYFGKPNKNDLDNANFLLHTFEPDMKQEIISSEDTYKALKQHTKSYGFNCNIELVKNLASSAMVVNSTKTLKIRKGTTFNKNFIGALAHHEIGVHMLTTINATKQPLKLLRLGLHRNTTTQEGLAILSEYITSNLSILRLKDLALRTIAINNMLKNNDFIDTFTLLMDTYKLNQDAAFYLTTRVYRAGGLTKDYLYLKGFKEIYNYHKQGNSITPLILGKCSLEYVDILDELLARNILKKPAYYPDIFKNNIEVNPVLDYIIDSLK